MCCTVSLETECLLFTARTETIRHRSKAVPSLPNAFLSPTISRSFSIWYIRPMKTCSCCTQASKLLCIGLPRAWRRSQVSRRAPEEKHEGISATPDSITPSSGTQLKCLYANTCSMGNKQEESEMCMAAGLWSYWQAILWFYVMGWLLWLECCNGRLLVLKGQAWKMRLVLPSMSIASWSTGSST